MNHRIEYIETGLDRVIKYFADAYSPEPITYEYFVDPIKNKVIFKLIYTGEVDERTACVDP